MQARRNEAQEAYLAAIALNPAIEDAAFASQLSGKVGFADGSAARAVPSIANDDTSAFDAVRYQEPAATRIRFDDVGGLEDVKREIRRRMVPPRS